MNYALTYREKRIFSLLWHFSKLLELNHLCKCKNRTLGENSILMGKLYLEVDHQIGHHQNHGRNGNTNTIQKFLER